MLDRRTCFCSVVSLGFLGSSEVDGEFMAGHLDSRDFVVVEEDQVS
jgi:hypothetical protein